MSSTSDNPSSPEVIMLDGSATELIELDRNDSNLTSEETTIDISNDDISIVSQKNTPETNVTNTANSTNEEANTIISSLVEEKKNDKRECEFVEDTSKNVNNVSTPKSAKVDEGLDGISNIEVDDEEILEKKNLGQNTKLISVDVKEDLRKKLDRKNEKQDSNKEPLVKVMFRDNAMFKKHYKKIESFLNTILLPDVGGKKKNLKSSVKDSILEIFESNESGHKSMSLKRPIGVELSTSSNDALFTIDNAPQLPDDIDIPVYGKKYKKALEKSTEGNADEAKDDSCPKLTCFNCLGNHNLRDCDEPRNYAAINKNRKEFASKRGPAVSRYHLEDDQKYDHFQPGQISGNLRKALGLKENSLPRHIYRMRRLGYPPGWMEEARLQHSGLSLFNSEGVPEEESDEEGEIINPGDKDKFDIKKIIDFPGFNIISPEGIHDEEYKHYWGSQVQQNNSKEAMLSYLGSKRTEDGYKRKKMLNPANTIKRTIINEGEMDLDDVEDMPVECLPTEGLFIPPLPKDENSQTPPPLPPADLDNSDLSSQENTTTNFDDDDVEQALQNDSPSLLDLENKKTKLLAALDKSQGIEESSSNLKIMTDIVNEEFNENDEVEIVSTGPLDSPKTEECLKLNVNRDTPTNSPKTPINRVGRKSTISVHVGTPILHSVSPFKSLPSAEKFSKDICDVINFENLPDSTGKYDQMSELLLKVRSKLRKE